VVSLRAIHRSGEWHGSGPVSRTFAAPLPEAYVVPRDSKPQLCGAPDYRLDRRSRKVIASW